jgi:hypothetical protein
MREKKMKKFNWLHGMITVSFLLGTPWAAQADFMDFLSQIHPSLGVQEDYSDNIDLNPTNKKEDFITTTFMGLRYSSSPATTETPGLIQEATPLRPSGLDLGYRLGLVFYAKNEENNYVSHEGQLNAWHSFGRHFSVRLRDYFIRSDEPREQNYSSGAPSGDYVLGTQKTRSIYLRNVVEPSVRYQFGREDYLELNYRNNIYQTRDPASEDSQENVIGPKLDYWFNIRNGITLEYGFTQDEFQKSPDMVGQLGRGRYTYRFNPKTSLFGEYSFVYRDFESPGIDYQVNNPSLGITHAFSRTLIGNFQGGYFWHEPKSGPSFSGPSLNLSLTQTGEKTTFNISGFGGYREDYITSENRGFVKSYRGIMTVSHRLATRFTVGLGGFVERAEYSDTQRDWIWEARGTASYQILRWLTISLDAVHREDNSNLNAFDYKENRGIIRLTASL